MVSVDFLPTGVVEKMASGVRSVKRAVQADLRAPSRLVCVEFG